MPMKFYIIFLIVFYHKMLVQKVLLHHRILFIGIRYKEESITKYNKKILPMIKIKKGNKLDVQPKIFKKLKTIVGILLAAGIFTLQRKLHNKISI